MPTYKIELENELHVVYADGEPILSIYSRTDAELAIPEASTLLRSGVGASREPVGSPRSHRVSLSPVLNQFRRTRKA